MNNDIKYNNNPRNGKAMVGIILLIVGAFLLLKQFSIFFIPDYIVLWPLWLVAWGLYIGSKSHFTKPSSFLLILLGIAICISKNIHGSDDVIWPLGIIAFGLWLILRRHHRFDKEYWEKEYSNKWGVPPSQQNAGEPIVDYTINPDNSTVPPINPSAGYKATSEDYLDTVSVFGSVKKAVLSKSFKGGEIVNIFGGAEIDFTQADIQGKVIIDITQIFGGVKMIVPPHWQVIPDIAAVFAGIEDKRLKSNIAPNGDKILILKGVSIFAGVDIKSY